MKEEKRVKAEGREDREREEEERRKGEREAEGEGSMCAVPFVSLPVGFWTTPNELRTVLPA